MLKNILSRAPSWELCCFRLDCKILLITLQIKVNERNRDKVATLATFNVTNSFCIIISPPSTKTSLYFRFLLIFHHFLGKNLNNQEIFQTNLTSRLSARDFQKSLFFSRIFLRFFLALECKILAFFISLKNWFWEKLEKKSQQNSFSFLFLGTVATALQNYKKNHHHQHTIEDIHEIFFTAFPAFHIQMIGLFSFTAA